MAGDNEAMDVTKLQAEIGKLIAESIKLGAETVKLSAETSKLSAETSKLSSEARWYPVIASAAFIGAVMALAKFLSG